MKQTTFRGKDVTEEGVIRAMHLFDAELRDNFTGWGIYAVERDGKLYPPKRILSMATGIDVDDFAGGEPTNSRFKDLDFAIVKLSGLESPDEIEDAVETSLSIERDLENFLVADLPQIESGLQLFNENEKTGRQFDAKDAGRIDILCVDQEQHLVVLELKAGEADAKVASQILQYMGWIEENIAYGRPVRGIIIANEFSEKLKYAVRPVPAITLKKYEVRFTFIDIPSIVKPRPVNSVG